MTPIEANVKSGAEGQCWVTVLVQDVISIISFGNSLNSKCECGAKTFKESISLQFEAFAANLVVT